MAKAFVIRKYGDYNVLKLENIDVSDPVDDEVQIEQSLIGVNHFDIHYRKGIYNPGDLPTILGLEACGVVVKIGPKVKNIKVGDKVVYGVSTIGAYATVRNISADLVLVMPKNLKDAEVLAVCNKGFMAHALLTQVVTMPREGVILIHGAAGGIGHLLLQMAKMVGYKVIGTVNSDEHEEYIKDRGCDVVVNTQKQDFAKVALEETEGMGVNIIYDCLGKDVFAQNAQAVRYTGAIISYGDVLGVLDNVNMLTYWEKSFALIRPCLSTLKARRKELVMSSTEIYEFVRSKKIAPKYAIYKFADLPKVHRLIEQGKHIGCVMVKV